MSTDDAKTGQGGPILTFHHPTSGEAVTWGELDPVFLRECGIGPSSWDQPVRVELVAQKSQRGNMFFNYEQSGFPLPDGLETELRVDDVSLLAEPIRQSRRGNPTRCYRGAYTISGKPYEIIGYVTKTRSSYWLKVHVQKLVGRRNAAEPRGGRFV